MTPDPQLNLTVIATATLERLLRKSCDAASMLEYADTFLTDPQMSRRAYEAGLSAMREADLTREAVAAVGAEIAAADDDATVMEANR